ncbi:MAG: cyclase family protein [Armatimonadetes bacterium]|nr:cyclase family protein [Armatimonadota bacterium]
MARRFIDLTLPLGNWTQVFPGDLPVEIRPFHTFASGRTNTSELHFGTHSGTHLDAPWHFDYPQRVDQIPLERLVGEAAVLDFTYKGAGDTISQEDLQAHAADIRPGSRLLLRTGWDRHAGTARYFQDYPALSLEAARLLAGSGVALIGLDVPSADPADSRECEAHFALLEAEVVIVESLTNLKAITGPKAQIAILPLKLAGLDGSPVRAVAWEDE